MNLTEIDLTGIPEFVKNPRQRIQEMIQNHDIKGLMEKAAELHGHLCSFVTLGLRAGVMAMNKLGEEAVDGMERVICIIECNNCFSDGIQLTTGCTFGNNALIFRDLGKNSFTLLNREKKKAFRVTVRPDALEKISKLQKRAYPEAEELFQKVVTKRQGTPEEGQVLKNLFLRVSYDLLSLPEEEFFTLQEVTIEPEKSAPIFQSHICQLCGEKIMETRARLKEEKIVCIPCAKDRFFQLDGSGISQKCID